MPGRRVLLGSILLWACGHGASSPRAEAGTRWEEGVRTKGGDSATARIPVLIARGEYAEAEVLIKEALKAGLLAGAQAERLRQQLRQVQEQRAGPGRPPPPVSPPWPDDTDPRDDERTCRARFPAYPLCQHLPEQYGFPSPTAALELMKRRLEQKGLQLHNRELADRGPCAGLGDHYNVRMNGGRVGSIVCCPCCMDSADGATRRQKCRIVW